MTTPWLVPHDEIDPDEWHPWRDNSPRLRPTASTRLSALHRSFFEAVAARPQIKVTTYVLTQRGENAESAHQALAEHAESLGWRLGSERFTDEWQGGPADARPAFNEACRYAAAGFAHGILAPDRSALAPSDEAYESYLRWLHDRLSFIAFLPAAAQPTSRPPRAHGPGEPGWPGTIQRTQPPGYAAPDGAWSVPPHPQHPFGSKELA
ncbi:recombinase family protein [Streptomyces sp. SYSU K217416]